MTIPPVPTCQRLKAAGLLAMTSALLTVPWFLLVFAFGDTGAWARWAQGTLLAGGTFIYVFLMTTLKRLLNTRYAFSRTDGVITLLVVVNVVSAAAECSALLAPTLERATGLFGAVVVVVIGVLQAVFGARLLRLPDDLRGLRTPCGYLNIATGLLLATVVLVPLGVLVSGISDVMLGTIFFQAAAAARQEGASS
jgi:hypothetical protein